MEKYPFWLALSDIHGRNIDKLAALPGLAQAQGVLFAGDFVRQGNHEARAAVEAISSINDRILAVPGNCDDLEVEAYLENKGMNIHRKAIEIAPGTHLIGLGGSTMTGFHTPREYREEDYAVWLNQLHPQGRGESRLALMSHTPPFDSGADRIFSGKHVGSLAVKEFISRRQPDLCICGHVHESKTLEKHGRTTLLNAGSFMDGGYALIKLTPQGFEVELKSL